MVTCDKCGAEMPRGAILCIKCGNRFSDSRAEVARALKISPDRDSRADLDRDSKIDLVREKQKELSKVKPPQSSKSESPYLEKKKSSPISLLIMPLLIVALVAVLVFVMSGQKPAECKESWACTNWTVCTEGKQLRFCADKSGCETEKAKPSTEQSCVSESIPINTTVELPSCTANLKACTNESECCNGFCVHHLCQSNLTFCGDGYCDTGEGCLNCTYDCGICPGERDLAQNFYSEPIGYDLEKNLTKEGYVIIRYFYAESCSDCFAPVNLESQLRDLAANYKGIVVVISLDAQKYRNDAERYASVGGVIVKPFIFIEGKKDLTYGRETLYGYVLKAKLQDEDLIGDLEPLICLYTDYCNFVGGKIVRV